MIMMLYLILVKEQVDMRDKYKYYTPVYALMNNNNFQ